METTETALSDWLKQRDEPPAQQLRTAGETVGSWRLLGLLGRGGSGEVWRARHATTTETVAVKFLHRMTPQSRERFHREAVLLSQLSLQGLPRFRETGEVDGIPFLVTEELEEYPLPSDDVGVARFILTLADTVIELHHLGIVHRDIKPANVLARRQSDGYLYPVLTDFGLLKHLPANDAPALPSLSVVEGRAVGVGTPGYAAPEQLVGGDISPATDIHALGVLIDTCFHHHPPDAWVPIIRRCTSSLADQRYASVKELQTAVRRRNRLRTVKTALACAASFTALSVGTFFGVRGILLHDLHAHDHLYVDARVAASGDGTRDRPFKTIMEAVRVVNPDGFIDVAPGTYDGPVILNGIPDVTLTATGGPERTILRGRFGAPVVIVMDEARNNALIGFTITGGTGTFVPEGTDTGNFMGGGIDASVSSLFMNCRIVGNGRHDRPELATTIGGGALVSDGLVRFGSCVFSNNYARAEGSALYVLGDQATTVLDHVQIVDNHLADKADGSALTLCWGGMAQLFNSRIAQNDGASFNAQRGSNSQNTRIELTACDIAGGARPGHIAHFEADEKSRRPFKPAP